MVNKSWQPDLRKARRKKGKTLYECAELLSIDASTLSLIERGKRKKVDVRLALGIESVYGISIREWGRGLAQPESEPRSKPTASLETDDQ